MFWLVLVVLVTVAWVCLTAATEDQRTFWVVFAALTVAVLAGLAAGSTGLVDVLVAP